MESKIGHAIHVLLGDDVIRTQVPLKSNADVAFAFFPPWVFVGDIVTC